jgi:4-hydroxy-tetrahydrodipicolinate synthase
MHDCLSSLHGSAVAIVTPFRDGRLDAAALARLCERQIERGTAALVVCGSTGEAAALSPAEQADVIGVAVRVAGDRVPVISGCTASATEQAVALAAMAAGSGARALLCAAPPYVSRRRTGSARMSAPWRTASICRSCSMTCRLGSASPSPTIRSPSFSDAA